MNTKIYVLCAPDGEIRYIGKTSSSISARFRGHLSCARCGEKSYLYNWLRSILATGYLPSVSLIGEVEGQGCEEEKAWIAYGRLEGWRLTNTTDGGDGTSGHIYSEEERKHMREGHLRHPVSDDGRRRMSEAHKGKPQSEAHRAKVSLALIGNKYRLGIPHSEESRRKMSVAGKGKLKSEAHRLHISEGLKGRTFSPEHRRKIKEARKNRPPCSEETRRKMSEAHKGNPSRFGQHLSLEARHKLSDSLKKRWQQKRNEGQI